MAYNDGMSRRIYGYAIEYVIETRVTMTRKVNAVSAVNIMMYKLTPSK